MTQTLRPISTVAAGPWSVVGATTRHEALADTSDASYITATSPGAGEFALSAGEIPVTLAGHTLPYRARASGGGGVQMALVEGSTVIATDVVRYPGAAFTDYLLTLTNAQAAAIGNRANLRLRLTAVAPPGAAATQYLWTGLATIDGITVSAKLASTGTAGSARLVVSTAADLSNPLYSMAGIPDPTYRIVKLARVGLAPDTAYHYGIEVDGILDAATRGRFRTLPATANFSIVLGACANYLSTAAFAAINAISPKPALFLQLGDFHYSDLSSASEADRHTWFDSTFSNPTRHQTYREIPTVYTWDDHDFGPDDSAGFAADGVTKTAYRDASIAAFRRRVPQPQASAAADGSIYFSFITGRLRWIISDCRSSRTVKSATDNATKTVLGAAQKAWFKAEINAAASAGQAVAWANSFPWVAAVEAGADHWGGYSTERAELADHIKDAGMGGKVFILAGDMHALAVHAGADYATGGGASIPVLHAGPLSMLSSAKGGPYTAGPYPPAGTSAEVQQYGRLDLADNGSTLSVTFRGFSADGTQRMSHTFTPLAPVAQSSAEPLLVQQGAASDDLDATTIAVSLPAPATAGNLILLVVAPDKNSGVITQTAGATVTKRHETLDSGVSAAVFSATAAGGEQSFSFTWAGGGRRPSAVAMEYARSFISSPFDATITSASSGTGLVTSMNAVAATPQNPNALALAVFLTDTSSNLGTTGSGTWSNGFAQSLFHKSGGPAVGIVTATKAIPTPVSVGTSYSYTGGAADEAMMLLIMLQAA